MIFSTINVGSIIEVIVDVHTILKHVKKSLKERH